MAQQFKNLMVYKQYVNQIFIECIDCRQIVGVLQQLNQLHISKYFTTEFGENTDMTFLIQAEKLLVTLRLGSCMELKHGALHIF